MSVYRSLKEQHGPPDCDLCGKDIPEEYQGEDSLDCCGQEFCSFACVEEHVKMPYVLPADWRTNPDPVGHDGE